MDERERKRETDRDSEKKKKKTRKEEKKCYPQRNRTEVRRFNFAFI